MPESIDEKRARQTAAREALARAQRSTDLDATPVADFDSRRRARETAAAAERAKQQRVRLAETRAVHAPLGRDQARAAREHQQTLITRAETHRNTLRVANCGLCDDDGYRGATVCDHIDHAPAAARGMNLIRAALTKKGGTA